MKMAKQDAIKIQVGPKESGYFDWLTFLTAFGLVGVGLISIYSATYIYSAVYESGLSPIFLRQLLIAIAGFGLMIAVSYIPEGWLKAAATPFYGAAIGLLALVLFIGSTTAGTKGWISFGGFSVQPSEIAKLATILMLARYLSVRNVDVRSLKDFSIALGIVAFPAALILLEPDFGSASVFSGIFLGILLCAGFDAFILYFLLCVPVIFFASVVGKTFLIAATSALSVLSFIFRRKIAITIAAVAVFIALGFASPVVYENLMPHQKDRIQTFLNPGKDPRGKGYNVIQSILAVGSGGFAGKGFLQGTQTQLRYIPKQWTDFIFSVPTEEFGFIGGGVVILLLASIIWRALRIAEITDSKFYSLCAVGVASVFLYHSIINIGMAIGLIPVVGIPLPFMSAGGTSLAVNMTMVGLLLNIYRTKKKKRTV